MPCTLASGQLCVGIIGRCCSSVRRLVAAGLYAPTPCRTFCESTSNDSTDLTSSDGSDGVKACLKLKSGQRVEIVQGSILDEDVDAIVNPTDSNLFHDSKLSSDIMKAAGYLARRQNEKLINRHASIPPGSIGVVTGGFLSCHSIIHAVAPKWLETGTPEEYEYCLRRLRSTLHYALRVCNDKMYYSISLPAIGAGCNGWPLNLCCQILLDVTMTFFETHPVTPLKYVCFTDINPFVVITLVNEAHALSVHPNFESIERPIVPPQPPHTSDTSVS